MAGQPLVSHELLTVKASRPYSVRHNLFGRTPLQEWLARRRDLYLATHNTHKRQIPLPPAGLEPAVPAIELQQIHALDLAVIEIGSYFNS